MTIRELRDAVRRNLRTENLPITDAQIDDFIMEVIADLSEDYDLLTHMYSFDTRRDIFSYRLPPEVKRVLYVFYRPSATATFSLITDINGNEITVRENLLNRGWNPRGTFRWRYNGRTYFADYEIIDDRRLRFIPYSSSDGNVEPPQMNTPNRRRRPFYIRKRSVERWAKQRGSNALPYPERDLYPPYTEIVFRPFSADTITISEEADWVQVHPTTPAELGVMGGEFLGIPNENYVFSTDRFEGVYRLWFMADKDGENNLMVYTINRFTIPNTYDPNAFTVPEQMRYRRLIVVIAVKRILTAFMGEEAMSWINLLTSEETLLRKAVNPPLWDVAGVGGLDIIRREGGVVGE